MNSTNNTLTTAAINSIIQETYETNIFFWISISPLTLLSYATLLKLPQEIECIWLKPFSLPTFLYIVTRYAPITYEGISFSIHFLPSPTGRACDMLANTGNSLAFLSFISVQGLLVARGYSICQGGKKLAAALLVGYLLGLVLYLHHMIAYPGCQTSSRDAHLLLVANISLIYTDLFVFGICMWKVWGIWKLKQEAGIQSDCSLVSVLFTQSILRCCFVIVITVATSAMSMIPLVHANFSFTIFVAMETLLSFQNCLSAILVADFTLDLRSLNSAKIEASQMSLPTIQFSNVLQRVHQSLLVELSTPEDASMTDLEGTEDYDHDNLGSSDDIHWSAQD